MYTIKGRPVDQSQDWEFCTNCEQLPDLFYDNDGDILEELEDWQQSTPDWEYKIVEVYIVEKE